MNRYKYLYSAIGMLVAVFVAPIFFLFLTYIDYFDNHPGILFVSLSIFPVSGFIYGSLKDYKDLKERFLARKSKHFGKYGISNNSKLNSEIPVDEIDKFQKDKFKLADKKFDNFLKFCAIIGIFIWIILLFLAYFII